MSGGDIEAVLIGGLTGGVAAIAFGYIWSRVEQWLRHKPGGFSAKGDGSRHETAVHH